jgi:hypothetical protein
VGQVKSLISFLQVSLEESGERCCTSTSRDWKTISARIEHEGLSFLGITLPAFGKDLERAIDQGHVTPDLFAGFRRRASLPLFLGGFLELVFDRSDGRLLDNPSIDAIAELRQITLACSKMLLPTTKGREEAALLGYIQTEEELRDANRTASDIDLRRFAELACILWGEVLADVDRKVDLGQILPTHGPGKTADRLDGNAKWNQRAWTVRLDEVFSIGDYLLPNHRYHESLSGVQFLAPGDETPVKVVCVPKTLKTPRIIAQEPTAMMYMQQGLLREIEGAVARSTIAKRFISWQSQIPNQDLARKGSIDGSLATLDLSEASDRVSNQHVRLLLHRFPNLFEAVDATRSRKADVRGHGVLRLAKFASMGSALTFPIEAMVFATIVFLAIEKELNRPLTWKTIKSFHGKVRIYGDDIIVPVEYVDPVITLLEAFGLKVNVHKSFWTGKFRESCGKEYYDGHDVSVCRVRRLFPVHRRDALEMSSLVSLRNQCYLSGRWKSARHLDSVIERLIPFPIVESTSPVLGRTSFLPYQGERDCPKYHTPLVKGAILRSVIPQNEVDDVGALLKCLLRLEIAKASDQDEFLALFNTKERNVWDLPASDDEHLERSGRPRTVDIKFGYHQPF